MPKKNDEYIVALGETHLGWGTHRYTNTREVIYQEGYLKYLEILL